MLPSEDRGVGGGGGGGITSTANLGTNLVTKNVFSS